MGIARPGAGDRTDFEALESQIHPVFALHPFAARDGGNGE